MRDPDATLARQGSVYIRTLRQPIEPGHFLRSELARCWVDRGDLIPFRLIDSIHVESPALPFVSFPYEWSDRQLYMAARLTLRLQQEAVEAGFDLKDASAWNVIFQGQIPVFCDLLSLQVLQHQRWWAAGQFTRHFLLPLLLADRRGLPAHQSFGVWRDGVPPALGRRLLGRSRYFTRYWPLLAGARDAAAQRAVQEFSGTGPPAASAAVRRFRQGLHASLSWMLDGVEPPSSPARRRRQGAWLGYSDCRGHYPQDSVAKKRETVAAWLAELRPDWVADLGCNDGEFSRLAVANGACVAAIDADHDCVQALFDLRPASPQLFTVIADLDDLSGGRGWAGSEHAGLASRLTQRFDMVLMLALLHHLAVGAAIPLGVVAGFAARCTRHQLVVEWIESTDPQMRELCAQRGRDPSDFSVDRQRAAFIQAGFEVEREVNLQPAARTLALLRHVPALQATP